MTKSEIFKAAHAGARMLKKLNKPGAYRELFTTSLKNVYARAKKEVVKVKTVATVEVSEKFVTVKEWIINKNLTSAEAVAVIDYSDCRGRVLKETEKAVFVKFTSKLGIVKSWFPKSCLVK